MASGAGLVSWHRSKPSPVLCAGGDQRGRSRLPEPPAPAHGGKTVDVLPTLSWPRQAGIVRLLLVDRFSSKVREPSLDLPCGYEHQNLLTWLSARNVAFSARGIQLLDAPFDTVAVAVHHYKERDGDVVHSASVFRELAGKTNPDELFACSTSFRRSFDPDLAFRPASFLEETSTEALMLCVFAQEDNLHGPPHLAHPRAINSESFRPAPTSPNSGLRAVTTPEFPR